MSKSMNSVPLSLVRKGEWSSMTLTVRMPKVEIEDARSCKYCKHVNVCALYRAIAPLLNQWEGRKPFEVWNLAKICKEYMPNYTELAKLESEK